MPRAAICSWGPACLGTEETSTKGGFPLMVRKIPVDPSTSLKTG